MLTFLELEAARYRLGLVTGRSLVQAAMATLSEGLSTVHIACLAGETDPLLRDAGPLFEKALDELGVPLPDVGQARWTLLRYHIQRMVNEEVDPRSGVKAIIDEVYHSSHFHEQDKEYAGDSIGIQALLGNYYAFDELLERPLEVSCDGKFGAEAVTALENHLLDDAREWLKVYGT
jgi:hypothetical protein